MKKLRLGYRYFKIMILAAGVSLALEGLSSAGILVTPERHILELNPKETAYVEYQVYNSGEEDIDMVIEPEELARVKENKDIDIDSWLKLKENRITVEAGKTKIIGVDIQVPEGAVGELDAMLYLRYKEDKDSMIEIRYGTPLYVLIKGTEYIKAEIKSINIGTRLDSRRAERKRMIISIDVANLGNRHIRPKVWAIIKDAKGKREEKIILANPWPIFGGQGYVYKIIWKNYNLEPGEYTCKAFFDYGRDEILEFKTPFSINEEGLVEVKKE